jgi:hypothetical protein
MVCRIILGVLSLAYVFALGIFGAGTFGWFGVEQDPLSGAYLILLGMPWVLIPFDRIVADGLLSLVATLAPLINLAILWSICWWLRR